MTGPIRDVESAVRELGALPMPTGPAPTVDELLAANARLQRKVASLKEQQERDDAEYAEAIKERDRALELVAELEATSVPDEVEYAVRMPGSNDVWPRREFREIGQWERVLADGAVLLQRVIRRSPWVEAPNQCPGFEGNPVAPDLCAGCHEPRDTHEAVA